MQRIYLIRSGETVAEQQGLCCGRSDLPLSPQGEQALKALRQEGGYPAPTGLRRITSGARRARQTAELLFGPDDTEEAIPAFRELDYGSFELQSLEELKEWEDFLLWQSDRTNNRAPGGESGADVAARVLPAFDGLVRDGRDAILVTHGGIIAAILEALFPENGLERNRLWSQPGRGWCVTLEGEKPLRMEPVPDPFLHQERTLEKKWVWIPIGMGLGAVASLLLAVYGTMRSWQTGVQTAFAVLAVALLVGAKVLQLRRLRCPYCGRGVSPAQLMGKKRPVCPFCGRAYRYGR